MKNHKFLIRLLSVAVTVILIISSLSVLPASASVRKAFESDFDPVNPNANTTCKNFYQYLCNVGKSNTVLSGAFSLRFSGVDDVGANDGLNPEEDYYKYIQQLFGVTPIVMGCRLWDEYIPIIAERYKEGAIPLMQTGGSSPTASALEDPKDVVMNYDATNPNRDMTIYNEYMESMNKLGQQLKRLEDLGVEVYFVRMYIEMNNGGLHGFYGETKEGCESFKRVWQQGVDYLINEFDLTGALFVYAPMGYGNSIDYYPGSDYVDVLAPTVYSNSADGELYLSDCKDYEWMKNENRPFGFSEAAARTGLKDWTIAPIGDYKVFLESMLYCFPEISFVDLWFMDAMSLESPGNSTTRGNYNGEYLIKHPQVIVAEEAIDYKSSEKVESVGILTLYTDEKATKKATSLFKGKFNSSDLKKKGIELKDIKSLDIMSGCAVAVYSTDDCTGTANLYYGKTCNISDVFSKAGSIEVIELENLAFKKSIWADNDDTNIFRFNDGINNRCVTEATNSDGSLKITIDLGSNYNVGQVSINHASFFEDSIYNMRDFEIFVSTDDIEYKSVFKMVGNVFPSSEVYFESQEARYICLKVITANNSESKVEKNRVSIADIAVYGTDKISVLKQSVSDKPLNNNSTDVSLGQLSNGYANEEVLKPQDSNDSTKEDEKTSQKPITSKIVIPEFYNYVWLIICGGILIISSGICALLVLLSRRKERRK